MSDNNLIGKLKPEALRQKLLNAKNLTKTVRVAVNSIEGAEIETTAAACGMTREELLRYSYKWKSGVYAKLSIWCAMRGHDVLQRAMAEFKRLGLNAEYKLYVIDIFNGSFSPQQGSFYIRIHDKNFVDLYKRHALPKLPDALPAYIIEPNLDHNGAVEITYEHTAGADEKPVRTALNALLGWVKALGKVDEDMFSAVKIFLN